MNKLIFAMPCGCRFIKLPQGHDMEWCSKHKAVTVLYEACLAARRYNLSICGKAIRGEVDLLANEAGISVDTNLDALYDDWQSKVNIALNKADGLIT